MRLLILAGCAQARQKSIFFRNVLYSIMGYSLAAAVAVWVCLLTMASSSCIQPFFIFQQTKQGLNQSNQKYGSSPGAILCLTSICVFLCACVGFFFLKCICFLFFQMAESELCVSRSLFVWIRTKPEDPAPCLCPSWLPPRSGLKNNSRHAHAHTHTHLPFAKLLSHTKTCTRSRPAVPRPTNKVGLNGG